MSEAKLNSNDLLKSFRESEPTVAHNVSWLWIPDRADFKIFDDVADAYVVLDLPQAESSVMVYAFYHQKWSANPWSSRPIIRKLLGKCGGATHDFNSGQQASPACHCPPSSEP